MKKPDKNSKTRENLMKSFVGESIARNRYTYYAKIAKKEGFEQISGIFLETADNERAHAKIFYEFLGEEFNTVTINEAGYLIGMDKLTANNLKFAAAGEHEENSILYPSYAKIAREEGYVEIADNYQEIIEVEKIHEKRYTDLIKNIVNDEVFKKGKEVIWKCRNCGYHHKGFEAPMICPACKHPKAYFEVFAKNY